MSCGVYKITNKLTGECYIGSSKNIEKRWQTHKAPSCHKKHPNILLYKAMEQYGIAVFQLDILEECSEDNLKQLEDKYIKKLQPTYNIKRAFRTSEEFIKQRKELKKRWQQAHKEHLYNKNKRWQENNPERAKKLYERWKAEHPDYMKQYYLKRKAAKQAVPET